MKINDYFDKVFCISLKRRQDRRVEFEEEFRGVIDFEFVDGFDHPTSATNGCTISHRTLLRKIANGPWGRVMIFEDDAIALTKQRLKDGGFTPENPVWKTHCSVLNGEGNLNERFSYLSDFLPKTFHIAYLGAGYGEPPISRYNKHVIRCGAMKTTSSYGITRETAKLLDDRITASQGCNDLETFPGHIDDLISEGSHDRLHYVLQPRLLYQRKTFSDIEGKETHQLFSMSDHNPQHEGLFPQ